MKRLLLILFLVFLLISCKNKKTQIKEESNMNKNDKIIELSAVKDAYVCDCKPDETNPNGSITELYQGQFGSKCFDRTFIQWDLTPIKDKNIKKAKMNFYCKSTLGEKSGIMIYYLVLEKWDDNTINFSNIPKYNKDIKITADWPNSNQWHVVDITDIVKRWLKNDYDNYGLYCHAESTKGQCVAGFYSSNIAKDEQKPKLVIELE